MNLKKNTLRMIYADTISAELIMSIYAVVQTGAYIFVPGHLQLEIIVVTLGVGRIAGLLLDRILLRLAVAYVAAFIWTFVAIFDYLAEPGGLGSQVAASRVTAVAIAVVNIWIAWRLQSIMQIRQDFTKNEH